MAGRTEPNRDPNLFGRHESRETPAEQLDYLRQVFDAAPVAYFITDGSLVVTDANREAQQLWGEPISAIRGQPLAHLVSPTDRHVFREIVEEILEYPAPVMRPISIRTSRGAETEVFFTARAQRSESGDPLSVYCVFSTSAPTEGADLV